MPYLGAPWLRLIEKIGGVVPCPDYQGVMA
jgi:hypothetical protein